MKLYSPRRSNMIFQDLKDGNVIKIVGKKSIVFTFLIVISLISIIDCDRGSYNNMDKIIEKNIKNFLSTNLIFFGHQSVGRNILTGITDLFEMNKIDAKTLEINDKEIPSTGIIHQSIGKNEYPSTKIADFKRFFTDNHDNPPDIALMKFCYVDTYKDNSPEEIFKEYVTTMESLEKQYPETTFIYVTMPLTSPMDKGLKNWAKSVFGRLKKVDSGKEENIPRNVFNTLLRDSKSATGRLFDLAKIESTTPNGKKYFIVTGGQDVPALYPLYTWDGGHLNEHGQKIVAAEFIKFIAGLEK